MLKARFCHMTSFHSSGYEMLRQSPFGTWEMAPAPLEWPIGQSIRTGKEAVRLGVLFIVTTPATCGVEVITGLVQPAPVPGVHPGGGTLACGAPNVLNSVPEEAVVSFPTMVLLMMFTFRASCSEMPPPSHPATLLLMMLLVTLTSYHRPGLRGNRLISSPLTSCKRRPPPLPLSAELPMIRLALIFR